MPRLLQVGQHAHPELRALPAGAGPQPEDVLLPGQGDADRGVDRPVGDLPVPDLDHDQRPRRPPHTPRRAAGCPVGHLLEDLVGDPADRLLRHRGAVDLGEVRADLAGGQALGIQRQHHLIHPDQPPLTLPHDLRLERAIPVPRHLDADLATAPRSAPSWAGCRCARSRPIAGRAVLLMAEMLGHLLVQRRLQHRLGQLLQQPVRAGQRQALLPGRATSSSAAFSSAVGSGFFFFVTPSSVAVITAPLPPSRQAQRDRAGNTVRSTDPPGLDYPDAVAASALRGCFWSSVGGERPGGPGPEGR